MQALTARRDQLQAELESQRQQIRRRELQWQWDTAQARQRAKEHQLEIERRRIALQQRVDELTSDLSDLDQNRRELLIRREQNQAAIRRIELEIEQLSDQLEHTEQLIQSRVASARSLQEVEYQRASRQVELEGEQKLSKLIDKQLEQVATQSQESKQRLQSAREQLAALRQPTQAQPPGEWSDDALSSSAALTPDTQATLEPFRKAIQVQDARIRALAQRIAGSQIVAPIDGRITEVHRRPGTFVQTGEPIVTIASEGSRWIVAFLNHQQREQLQPDAAVRIEVLGRQKVVADSKIAQLGEHFEQFPPELSRRPDIAQWGIPVKVPIPETFPLRPGQIVQLIFP